MNHPNTLSRKKTGLIVIDVQEKFQPVITGFDEIVQNIVRLILAFQMYNMPILVTEQYPKGLGRTVDILRRQFSPLEPIEKECFSCVGDRQFSRKLSRLGVETVVVCGIESHVCVNQTVLGLLQKRLRVHVVVDAVGSRRGLDHRMAMEKMMQAGVVPATTEMVLFELVEKSGTEEFKNIQRMVKSRLRWTTTMTATSEQPDDEEEQPEPTAEYVQPEEPTEEPEEAQQAATELVEEPAETAGDDEEQSDGLLDDTLTREIVSEPQEVVGDENVVSTDEEEADEAEEPVDEEETYVAGEPMEAEPEDEGTPHEDQPTEDEESLPDEEASEPEPTEQILTEVESSEEVEELTQESEEPEDFEVLDGPALSVVEEPGTGLDDSEVLDVDAVVDLGEDSDEKDDKA